MAKLSRNIAILALTATTAGCNAKMQDGGACVPDPVSAAVVDGLRLSTAVVGPMQPAFGARPAIVPTVEMYASCAAMQEDLRADWKYHRPYDDVVYQTNMPTVSSPPPSPSSPSLPGLPSGKCFAGGSTATASPQTDAPVATAEAKSSPDVAPAEGDAAGAAASNSFTNTQEKGVDEGDTVKIGDHHIYVQRAHEIQVVDRQTLASIGALPLAGLEQVTLYADGDTLVVIGQSYDQTKGRGGATTTKVQILTAAEGVLPVVVKEHELAGVVYDSRYAGGHLVLVFQDALPWSPYSDEPTAPPFVMEGDTVGGIPCDRIIKPAVHDFDTRFVKLVSIDARVPDAAPQFAAAIGGGDQMYMTASTLYLTKSGVLWNDYDGSQAQPLLVTKVDFDAATGAVTPVAAGLIDGRVKDQWAFNEYSVDGGEKVLAVATSTGNLLGQGQNLAQNHLWVLRQNQTTLETAAAIHDFGTGEDIRSVRYVNDMAYVVTFKKTDPLFAFDMTSPLAPKLLGELQVPGFSVYMHPVAAGLMLGVGFDAEDAGSFAWYQGLQVSLFDVSNPLDLKRLDNEIIGQRGSYSDVTGDHHAFYFDADHAVVGLPVVELGGKGDDRGGTMATDLTFSGAILYSVGPTAPTEIARLSHADLLPAACKSLLASGHWWQDKTVSYDINRLYTVDDKLLTVSRFGLKAYDFTHLDQAPAATVVFPAEGAEDLCPLYDYADGKL